MRACGQGGLYGAYTGQMKGGAAPDRARADSGRNIRWALLLKCDFGKTSKLARVQALPVLGL